MKQNNIEINDVVGKKILTYFKNGYSIRKISNLDNMPSYYKIIKFIKNNGLTVYNKAIERKFNSDEEELIIKRYTNDNIRRKIISGYIKLDDHLQTIDRLRFLDVFYQADKHNAYSKDLLGYVDKDIEFCLDDKSRDNCGGK